MLPSHALQNTHEGNNETVNVVRVMGAGSLQNHQSAKKLGWGSSAGLLIVVQSISDSTKDTIVETFKLLVLGGHIGGGWFGGEEVHQAREEAVHCSDDLRVGAVHAGCDATLKWLEAGKYEIFPL